MSRTLHTHTQPVSRKTPTSALRPSPREGQQISSRLPQGEATIFTRPSDLRAGPKLVLAQDHSRLTICPKVGQRSRSKHAQKRHEQRATSCWRGDHRTCYNMIDGLLLVRNISTQRPTRANRHPFATHPPTHVAHQDTYQQFSTQHPPTVTRRPPNVRLPQPTNQ